MSKSFEDCYKIVSDLVPRNLKNNNEYKVILKLLSYSIMKLYETMERIENAYSVDSASDEELPKIADTLSIVYPIGSDIDKLRLLLKYYGKILKNRGTISSIKQMIRILELDEITAYTITPESYNSVIVSETLPGFLLIKCDNITDLEFANIMMRKVVPAGYRFSVMNRNGPLVLGFEVVYINESHIIEKNEVLGEVSNFIESSSIEKIE